MRDVHARIIDRAFPLKTKNCLVPHATRQNGQRQSNHLSRDKFGSQLTKFKPVGVMDHFDLRQHSSKNGAGPGRELYSTGC